MGVAAWTLAAALALFGIGRSAARLADLSSVGSMSATATGAEVVDVRRRVVIRRHSHYEEYSYVVEFADPDGVGHACESVGRSRNRRRHSAGDEVDVTYDPMDADGGCLIVGDEDLVASDRGRDAASVAVAGLLLAACAAARGSAWLRGRGGGEDVDGGDAAAADGGGEPSGGAMPSGEVTVTGWSREVAARSRGVFGPDGDGTPGG